MISCSWERMSSVSSKPHVVKLAQPGFDVKTAGDENLIYSSLWSLLKIYKQGTVTVPNTSQMTLATHDLGYPPMYWFFTNNNINAYEGSIAFSTQRRSEFFGPGGDGIKIYDNRLVFAQGAGNDTGALKLYYYIFAIDLTKQYNAPITNVGDVHGDIDQQHVFKVAKPGKSVHSKNLDDFVIHSRARSPLLHSVNPSGATVKSFTVTHGLGYLPIFFGYTKQADGAYKLIATGQGGDSSFQSSETNIKFADSGGKEVTIVILKDPFNVDYSVSVKV